MAHDVLDTAVAVVGIGCRFPDADDAHSFWSNLLAGRQSFGPVPRKRWDHRAYYSTSQRDVDKTWTPHGAFIEDVESFAALHFGIAPRRLEVMDPQHRLLVDATAASMQDAGYELGRFDKARTGVFAGLSVSEYKNIMLARVSAMMIASGEFGPAAASPELRRALVEMTKNVVPMRAFSLAGSLTNMAAASVSQTFDFSGPSYTVDAACAAGSAAIADGILHLRAGLIDVAFAGGVYLNLTPDNLIAFTRVGAISPSGVCRPFDARADGFVQGDGVGVLMLKRVGDALRDGDRLYGVIRGVGVNNDGRGEGPMTPRTEGQLAVLRAAYRDAQISPATVAYFEAHGTATRVGDPVEVEALGRTLVDAGVTAKDAPLLGSVKANIGHTMSTAGVAGLIKVLKAVEHRTAPPLAGFEKPHPILGLEQWPLRPSPTAEPLVARGGGPLRAAVSAFGFGGTNVHMVVEEAPERIRRRVTGRAPSPWPEAVLTSAPTLPLLAGHLLALAEALEGPRAAHATLAEVAWTLSATRSHERYRVVISAPNLPELVRALRRAAEALPAEPGASVVQLGAHTTLIDRGESPAEAPKVALLFPGQGAQRLGLGADLRARWPRFAELFDRLAGAADGLLPAPLGSYLYPRVEDEAAARALTATAVCQPALAALSLALGQWLEEAGVRADVTLGHSLGEMSAMAHGGILEREATVAFVALRGKAMEALELIDTGKMSAVQASADEVRAAIAGIEGVAVANLNHPRQVTLSGTSAAVEQAEQALAARGLEARRLDVSHAFHSPIFEGLRPAMARLIEDLELHAPTAQVASCIAERPHDGTPEHATEILMAHATAPVDFVRGLHQARAAGAQVFVQAGAGAALARFARATFGPGDVLTLSTQPAEPDAGLELVHTTTTLAALGVPVRFEALFPESARGVVDLPRTPLVREAYWAVRDEPQLTTDLNHPFPVEGERFGTVDLRAPEATMTKNELPTIPAPMPTSGVASPFAAAPMPTGGVASPFAPAPMSTSVAPSGGVDAALVALFSQQADILRAHAEILAAQNRALLGASGLPGPAYAPIAAPAGLELRAGAPGLSPWGTPTGMQLAPPSPASLPPPPPRTSLGPAPLSAAPTITPTSLAASLPPLSAAALSSAPTLAPAPGAAPTVVPPSGPAPIAVTVAPEASRPAPPPAAEIEARVLEVVAKVSAFPKGSLRADQKLVEELGFDSLMVADLGKSLDGVFPTLGGVPAKLFSTKTTVRDLVAHVAKTLAEGPSTPAAAVAAGAPLTAYRPVVVGRPDVPATLASVRGQRWLLVAPPGARALAHELVAALESLGASAAAATLDPAATTTPADLLGVWPEAALELLATRARGVDGLLFLADGSHPLPARPLHVLMHQLRPSRVGTVVVPGTPAVASALGYTRALGRERPEALVRTVELDPTTSASAQASFVLSALLGADRDVDTVMRGAGRASRVLVPEAVTPASPLGAGDVVLIVGGAGELGLLTARALSPRKLGGLVLLGRSPLDARLEARTRELSALGTPTRYVSADAADAEQLARALAGVPDITCVIHAAGLADDATADKKTLGSFDKVVRTKVMVLDALTQVLPAVKTTVLYSSWAGYFGNAGQTDYAAANAVLDAWASAPAATRRLSLAWPPWASSAMVQKIPAGVRSMLAQEGVTFVEDAEGVALALALIDSALAGTRVVGRALPARVSRVEHTEVLSLATAPYLDDHRLAGEPVLPLAGAADLLAAAAHEVLDDERRPRAALVLEGLELIEGVIVRGPRALSLTAEARGDSASVALAADGRPAYRARAALVDAPTLPSITVSGTEAALGLSLARYYGEYTFHGPRLQGIQALTRMTDRGIAGVLVGSELAQTLPGTPRTAWALDPILLDSAFQLAGYWALLHHQKAGYPIGVRRITQLAPLGAGPVTAEVALSSADGDRFEGHVRLSDAQGRTLVVLEGVEGRFAPLPRPLVLDAAVAPSAPVANGVHGTNGTNGTHGTNGSHDLGPTLADVPREAWSVGEFPEVEALDQRLEMAKLIGLKNPYFTLHHGTARNRSVVEGVEMINFSSYNYLGFSGHPAVVAASQAAIDRYGTSVSASRVASGERPIHRELERGLADHIGVDDAVVMVSGHATNVTTIATLLGPDDIVFHDSLIHESILAGIKASGAVRRPFTHGNLDALERALAAIRSHHRRALIVAEGIYSMDGDVCDLPRLIELKKTYKTLLMIDEAHSIGVLGPRGEGVGHHFPGVDPRDIDVWMGTLSKSFASCGGYIAGSAALVRLLKYSAGGFVYSAGITPPNAGSALESLHQMRAHPEVVEKLRSNSVRFVALCKARGLDTGLAVGAAVVPVIVGNSLDALKLSAALAKKRINVNPIVYPAVEDDAARLRFFISSTHTDEELVLTADTVAEELARVRRGEDEPSDEARA
jgi:acyl transferase domain-containing protein/7-keto-8-aminopelargonate synthetase-like enzyme